MTSTSSDTVIMEVIFQNGKLVQLNASVLSIKWTGDIKTVSKVIAFCDGTHHEVCNDKLISYSENPFCGEIPQRPCPKIVEDEEVAKLKKGMN